MPGLASKKRGKEASSKMGVVSTKDIRTWLEAQDRKTILNMLMEQVASDDRLRRELVLKIAKENARGIDLAAYRTAISDACEIPEKNGKLGSAHR